MSKFNRLRFEPLEARDVPAGNLAYAIALTGVPVGTQLRTVVDSANSTYVAGSFSGTLDLDPTAAGTFNVTSNGGTDVFAAKYSPTGQLVWGKTLGGTSDDTAADVALDGASNVYIGGTFVGKADFDPKPLVTRNLTASASGSAFVWKLTTNGDFYMGRSVAGTSTLSSIAITPRGDISAVGKFMGTADFDPSHAAT